MTWERACVGVPTLAFGTAGNQQSGLADLIEAGYLIGLPALPASDSRTIANWIDCALGNPPLLRGLAKRSFDLVDGLGAERIADILVSPSLHFRPATLADSEAIRSWRNHPSVRTMSLDSREIPETAHQAWMQNILDNPARRLLIVEREGRPVGVVRFDLEGQAATISVYRTPPPRPDRCGLIRAATDWLRRQHPEIRRIRAVVVAQNTASLAAFRAAGYRDAENRLEIELDKP